MSSEYFDDLMCRVLVWLILLNQHEIDVLVERIAVLEKQVDQ